MHSAETTDALVARVLGVLPNEATDDVLNIGLFVAGARLLRRGEVFIAGIDDTWTGSARRGRVLTNERVFRYRNREVEDLLTLSGVERVIVRRMWYPGAGSAGRRVTRGFGRLVILRFRFFIKGGTVARVRVQGFAATLHPFVRGVAERFAGTVEVARTLPGF